MFVPFSASGITLKWGLANKGLFATVDVERSATETGPWAAVAVDRSEEGDLTVAVDKTAEAGRSYWYRLVATTNAGSRAIFGPISGTASAPVAFALSHAWPNPTQGAMQMVIAVPRASAIRLSVVDLQGREVEVLAQGTYQPGRYQVSWDGRANRSGPVPAGMYFIRYTTPEKTLVTRVAITR